ncbi:MAG: AmmeMemoRadiSam system radical SAM enzyme [bacterium]|nr:AmmeMemoRadiSam system radical SAM enzyme [bacterium]
MSRPTGPPGGLGLTRRSVLGGLAGGAGCLASERILFSSTLKPGEALPQDDLPAQEASWYRKLPADRVECQLCPQACKVADAERGMCGVRENRSGTYYTLVHGVVCSAHTDPIEKKPFFHVLPGESAFSYATPGCNVECKFCQNWEISQFRPEQVPSYYLPPVALARAALRSGARATAATYSEPVVFWEFVRDAAVAARKLGLRSTVVTNGFIQEAPLLEVLPHLDAVKVDLKSFRDEFYHRQVRGELKPVLKALELIRSAGVWLEIVVLVIPTLNDTEREIRDLSKWVKANLGCEVPVHFTRFHPTYRLTNLPPTPVSVLERCWASSKAEGLDYVYVGNVPGHKGEHTYCPDCGHTVVRRIGFRVLENELKDGACSKCKRTIAGLWS